MALIADGGGGFTYPTFQVEINSLADFLAFIEHDLGSNLNTGVDRIKSQASDSAGLGAGLPGEMIQCSRTAYLRALGNSVDNLVRYMFTAAAMLEVTEQLMKMYKTTEEMAALTVEQVNGFLTAVYEQKYQELKDYEAQRSQAGGQLVV